MSYVPQPNAWGRVGDPNADNTGQIAHVAVAYAIFLTVAFFLGPILAGVASIGTFLVKESLEALGYAPWEGKQPWFSPWKQSSARDFVYSLYGTLGAFAIVFVMFLRVIGVL